MPLGRCDSVQSPLPSDGVVQFAPVLSIRAKHKLYPASPSAGGETKTSHAGLRAPRQVTMPGLSGYSLTGKVAHTLCPIAVTFRPV
jgi:hypothetical protein